MQVVYVLKREDKPSISKVGRSDNSGKTSDPDEAEGKYFQAEEAPEENHLKKNGLFRSRF